MRTIQSVGTEIFNGNIKPFYIFLGEDYGIKARYIDIIKAHYGGHYSEINQVSQLFSFFKIKRLMPLIPKLYIVRYDADWVSSLNDRTKDEIERVNITGTVVLVYEDKKQCDKINKYLPDYCVSFDKVSTSLIIKYLSTDYPQIPESIIKYIAENTVDYFRCDNICQQLLELSANEMQSLSDADLADLFYISSDYSETKLKSAVKSRNAQFLLRYISSGTDLQNFPYTILSALLDIEKEISGRFKKVDKSLWTFDDIFNYYNLTYHTLMRIRSERIDVSNILSTLVMLLRYSPIPNLEDVYGS